MFFEVDKKWEERIYFASYTIWMVAAILKITMFRYIDTASLLCTYMQRLAYLLIVVLFFVKKRNTVKDIAGIAMIMICFLLARYSVYNTYIIATSIYLYFGADLDFKKILKCTLLIQAVMMVFVILSSQGGLIEDVIWTVTGRDRHALGYDYCAYPAHLLLFMSLMWFCIRKKITAVEVIIALALNYLMYDLTASRADFILAVIGILGFTVWQLDFNQKWINAVRKFIAEFAFVILAVLSILAQALYDSDNELFVRANWILTDRLKYGHEALETYGLSFLGEQVQWFGQGSLQEDPTRAYNYVDNAYLKDGISFGIIFLILLAIGFFLLGRYLIANKEYKLSWAVLVSLAYAVVNAHLCMLTFNVFILLLGCFFKKTSEKDQMSILQRFRIRKEDKQVES